MTNKDYSLDALIRFHDYAAEKGLLKRNTAQARKLASTKILANLDATETADLRTIDVERAFDRFQNLEGTAYKPDSLQVYLSRLRAALADFFKYVDDPVNFKPAGNQHSSAQGKRSPNNAKPSAKTKPTGRRTASEQGEIALPAQQGIVVPIPLRADITLTVSNLPADLTRAEAARVAAIINAYAVVEEN